MVAPLNGHRGRRFVCQPARRKIRLRQAAVPRRRTCAAARRHGPACASVGKRLRIVNRHQQRVDARARDLAAAGHVGRNDRPAAGGGFQQAFRQALRAATAAPRYAPPPRRGDVGHVAEHARCIGPLAPALDFRRRDRRRIGRIGFAGDQQPHGLAAPRQQRTARQPRCASPCRRAGGRHRPWSRRRRAPAAACKQIGVDAGAGDDENRRAGDAERRASPRGRRGFAPARRRAAR